MQQVKQFKITNKYGGKYNIIAYVIRVYLEDGSWYYARNHGYGSVEATLTSDVSYAICFRTTREANDYFYKYIENARDRATGLRVDNNRTCFIQVETFG